MTANEKRQSVAQKYATIIGRNYYSQNLRDYCFKKYLDGKYYSDCSSSISYAYKEAGFGFGILSTASIYTSPKLTTVDIAIKNGQIADISLLRIGDMLEFAGTDSSRPLKIGHVEMVYSINANGHVTLCGHGSGRPSYKDMNSYCTQRYNSLASGGWRMGLVCVRRFIQDTPVEKKSGWYKEGNGWRFYLGDTGNYIINNWYKDKNEWYWFDGSGFAIHDAWYQDNGKWYYFDSNCQMVREHWILYHEEPYYFTKSGIMYSGIAKTKDNGAFEIN